MEYLEYDFYINPDDQRLNWYEHGSFSLVTKSDQYVCVAVLVSKFLDKFLWINQSIIYAFIHKTPKTLKNTFQKKTILCVLLCGHGNNPSVALLFALFKLTKHLIPFPV